MKSKTMFKRFLYLSSLIFVLFLLPAISHAAPKIFYTDIVSGPNTGGENNNGAYLSIFGKGFGATRGASTVRIGGGEVVRYIVWSDTKVSVQLGPAVASGNIVITTSDGSATGPDSFTARAGNFYFVSLAGSDSTGVVNDINRPFRTPNYVVRDLSSFKEGDSVIVRGGTYDLDDGTNNIYNSTFLRVNKSGTTGNPMTFMGYPGETVNIQMDTSNMLIANGVVVTDWVVANFVVSINHCQSGNVINFGGTTTAAVCQDTTGTIGEKASRIRVVNIEIDGHDIGGMCNTEGDNVIEIGYSDSIKILGNSIHNTSPLLAGTERSHLIYLATRQTNTEVGWNSVYNIPASRAVIQVHQDPFGGACYGSKFLTDIKIHDNLLYNLVGQPILLDGGTGDIDIYNNVIYKSAISVNGGFSGDIVSLRGSGGMLNARLYNNTFYVNPGYTNADSLLYIGSVTGGYCPQQLILYNNIFYITDANDAYFFKESACSSNSYITSNNNIWYGSSSGLPSFAGTNDRSVDPQFINSSAADFTLQSSSPAIDTGSSSVASVVTKDFDGNTRPMGAGYDIGAYEYAGPAVPMLQFSSATYSVSESTATATISVTRTGSASGAVSVNYATSNGTATAGSDYTAASGTLNWTDGEVTTKTFTVSIINDTLVESDETINLTLSNPTGGAILGSQSAATLTILDDDGPSTLRFENSSYSVSEGAGTATIRVLRTGSSASAVSVNYATSNGTATAGSDYTAASGTLNWASGDTAAKSFTITIINDTVVESNETVNLTLSNPTNGAVLGGTNPVVLTITDNDSAGGGSSGVNNLNAAGGGDSVTGGGCGFVKDDNGKGPRANGGAATFAMMLIMTSAGIAIARRFSNRFSYNL